jgi:hypothetical protein
MKVLTKMLNFCESGRLMTRIGSRETPPAYRVQLYRGTAVVLREQGGAQSPAVK